MYTYTADYLYLTLFNLQYLTNFTVFNLFVLDDSTLNSSLSASKWELYIECRVWNIMNSFSCIMEYGILVW